MSLDDSISCDKLQNPSIATRFGRELPFFLDGKHTISVIVASLPALDREFAFSWHGAAVIYDHRRASA